MNIKCDAYSANENDFSAFLFLEFITATIYIRPVIPSGDLAVRRALMEGQIPINKTCLQEQLFPFNIFSNYNNFNNYHQYDNYHDRTNYYSRSYLS